MTELPTPPAGRGDAGAAPLSLHLLRRFVLAGVFNTLFHAGVFTLLVVVTDGIRGGWLIAVSWLFAMPVAYVVQSTFVWRKAMSLQGLVKLAISYVPGFFLSTGLGFLIGSLGGSYFWQEFVGVGVATGVGFILQRHWVYRR